ncbi:MAG: DNA polymerase I [Candidatus Omnitrophica bacterium]|nr:DNA polymerase I [Candidatus Omnitrophota bacterium]
MTNKGLYLIDATAFCYRAFYALKGLSTSFGQPTNAIYGFVQMLNKILKENRPEYLAICFDVSRDTFRAKRFTAYKIQRPSMPEGLATQIPLIKEIIKAYRINIFELEGYEADDIIATLVKKARQEGIPTTIVSSDKDVLQLVDEHTRVFSPYKDEGIIYDPKKVMERFGVEPKQIPEVIALMGDSVDNIPGVPGVGEKTAVELISTFGSLEKLLKNIDKVKQEKLRQALKAALKEIRLSFELAVLKDNLDIDFDLKDLKITEPDYKELFRIFKYLEFRKLLNELPLMQEKEDEVKLEKIKDEDLKSLVGSSGELVLYGTKINEMVYFIKDKFFQVDSLGANLKDILKDANIKKISHDLKKVKLALAKEGINLEGLYFDTMLAAYLLNPARPEYKLTDIAFDYLGKFPPKSLDNQGAVDLIVKLKPILQEELKDKSLISLFMEIEMPLIAVLTEMELNGIKLDLGVLRVLSMDVEKRLAKLIDDIYSLSGCQFNINSPKQLRHILFERLKLPVVKRSKTGPSTDEEVLRTLGDRHKLPALLLEYRQLMKLKTTYIDTLPRMIDKRTAKLHTSFNQTATETGRLSSSNPNLQNIPIKTDIGRKIRQAIVASCKDNYLLSGDYSQIELRILAHLSSDENLISSFRQGKDMHRATAALIYGLDEEDITDAMREMAKRVNFGIIYGLTPYGLARDLNIPVEQAQSFIDAYFSRYPKVKDYIERQIGLAKEKGYVTTILGRRRYIPEINHKNQTIRQFAQRQAVNTPIQGSASDLIKLAMIRINNEIKSRNLNSRMVLQIHDELVFDVPNVELKELIDLVRKRMENVLELKVPIKVQIKKGQNWLEMEEVK